MLMQAQSRLPKLDSGGLGCTQ